MDSIRNFSITGSVEHEGRITGQVHANESMRGKVESTASVVGHLAANNFIEYAPVTYIIVDENGNEIPAVMVAEEVAVTAGTNDIRLGSTAITGDGVITGEKEIPAYYVAEGYRSITAGRPFIISTEEYDYTKMQALICRFGTNVTNSVYTEKAAIDNNVYNVNSTDVVSIVTKNHEVGYVDLGITNDTENRYLVRYFMYKEVQ